MREKHSREHSLGHSQFPGNSRVHSPGHFLGVPKKHSEKHSPEHFWGFPIMGDRFLSSAGAGGNCARPMRLPDSPVLDTNHAPMGPGILSSTGAGVWRKAPMAFPDSSSVLDKFPSAT